MRCRRAVPDSEIFDAIENSAQIKNEQDLNLYGSPDNRWPEVDYYDIQEVVSSYDNPIKRLWEASAFGSLQYYHLNFAPALVQMLFPGDPLICAGESVKRMKTRHVFEWGPEICSTELIVPSPMIAREGMNLKGEKSTRCLANTGPRRFLVIEFGGATIEAQACLHMHLAMRLPLAMVVHSGGRSLHGWYFVAGLSEDSANSFMRYAVSLGAGPHTWTPCQAVCTPGGERRVGSELVRQEVYFLNANYEK
ncbi:MAG: hypothetical protein KDN20_15395 [Verrucomicrobiae bacterium]|nr:hypothetical protein [Verrucomicrobiae bacterium]